MTPFVETTLIAAHEIAAILHDGWRQEFGDHGGIGAGGDRTAGIDTLAENIYIEKLSKFGKIDSEEAGIVGSGEATIVIGKDQCLGEDPIVHSFGRPAQTLSVTAE